jgi:lauroyl/myristoyl acyltransferase
MWIGTRVFLLQFFGRRAATNKGFALLAIENRRTGDSRCS